MVVKIRMHFLSKSYSLHFVVFRFFTELLAHARHVEITYVAEFLLTLRLGFLQHWDLVGCGVGI